MFGRAMEMGRAGFAIVLAILLCASAMRSSQGRTTSFLKINEKMIHDTVGSEKSRVTCAVTRSIFRSYRIYCSCGHNAEKAWIHCKKELAEKRDAIKDFDMYIPQAISELISELIAKQGIRKAIDILPPQLRATLFDCLRKKRLVFHGSDPEVNFKHWFQKCLEFILKLPNSPRRYLVSVPNQHISLGPSPALVPEIAAAATPVLAPAPAPAAFSYGSALFHQAHKRYLRSHSPGGAHDGTQDSPDEEKDVIKTVIAVIATAATTFAIVTLVFFCCLKRSIQKKDEKLFLRLSDYLSPDFSQKSGSLGSFRDKKISFRIRSRKNSSFNGSLSTKQDNHDASSLAKTPLEASSGAAFPPLKPPPGRSAPPPPPAPPPPRPCPNPPPPPKVARPPPMPPKSKPSPLGPHHRGHSASGGGDETDGESGATKAKLKPFFWDKVTANSDQTMVWHEIKAGSFQFNEEMIETLFGYNQGTNNKNHQKRDSSSEPSIQYIQIIDTRKAQNLSILLRALNVTTEEVVNALREGNKLPTELLQTLLKMAPTTEEELKLRLFAGDVSQLGPAERFLKILIEIPFAFKRIESLLFMSTLHEEVTGVKESFATLEVACTRLKSSRLFLKLLEAVLKTGNRMNDGTYRGGAQAFKLDTLLKLSDVKGIDGTTTLLHFVVQEIIRSEGVRAVRTQLSSRSLSCGFNLENSAEDHNQDKEEHHRNLGLQVVSGLSSELEDVKKAAVIDADALTSTVSKLNHSLNKTTEFMNSEMKSADDEDSKFFHSLSSLLELPGTDIRWLSEEEKRITKLVMSTADYFHGQAGRNEGLRLFGIVRDFLAMLDNVCKEVRDSRAKPLNGNSRKEGASTAVSSPEKRQPSCLENRQPSSDIGGGGGGGEGPFPAISEWRMEFSSSDSDDGSSSP